MSELSNQKLFIRASLIRGKYLLAKRKFNEARIIFEDVIGKAEVSGNLVYQMEATQAASLCYKALGEHAKAHELIDKFEVLE